MPTLPPVSTSALDEFFDARRRADARHATEHHRGPRPLVILPDEFVERNAAIEKLRRVRLATRHLRRLA